MKVYTQHNCTKNHRLPRAFAQCAFPRAVWVAGDGVYASIAWCGVSVLLHKTEAEALQSKGYIDGTGCGGRCQGETGHEVVRLSRKPEDIARSKPQAIR